MVSQDFSWVKLEEAPEKPSSVRRWSLRIIVASSVILLLQLLFHLALAPQIKITRVVIQGGQGYADEEIMALAGLKGREYYFSVDQNRVKQRLEASGRFKEARVEKVFPDTLRLDLVRRVPVAVSLANLGGRTVLLEIDAEGWVCGLLEAGGDVNLPVLSGVEFPQAQVGLKLPEGLVLLLEDLAQVKAKSLVLYQWISEIRVHKSRNESFTTTIYPGTSPLRILMGDRLELRLLKEAAVVEDILQEQKLDSRVRTMDFRTEQIVLSTAEG